ncbi:MAG TPA: response regulator transcription factor [Deinococcales bacterium]|nr:response regulator transcription factor [Deinococcales bacterium]
MRAAAEPETVSATGPEAAGPRVVLAGRSRAWREGVRAMLDPAGETREAASAVEALEAARAADVLVIDDDMAVRLGPDTTDLPCALVVLGDDAGLLTSRPAEAGFALLPPDAGGEQLRAAVLAAAAGLVVLPAELAGPLLVEAGSTSPLPDLDEPLSDRELDVLRQLADGLSNKRIARALSISENTVKYHLAAVYGKLGVSSRAMAVRRGMELGLVRV